VDAPTFRRRASVDWRPENPVAGVILASTGGHVKRSVTATVALAWAGSALSQPRPSPGPGGYYPLLVPPGGEERVRPRSKDDVEAGGSNLFVDAATAGSCHEGPGDSILLFRLRLGSIRVRLGRGRVCLGGGMVALSGPSQSKLDQRHRIESVGDVDSVEPAP
jgi:hypothetical protein